MPARIHSDLRSQTLPLPANTIAVSLCTHTCMTLNDFLRQKLHGIARSLDDGHGRLVVCVNFDIGTLYLKFSGTSKN